MKPETLPYQAHSPTSKAGAKIAQPLSGSKRKAVYKLIKAKGGLTDNEIISHFVALGHSPNGPRARRVELVRFGLVEQATDEKKNPITRNGSAVWRAV